MTSQAKTMLAICEKLSAARQAEVIDFARFLLFQEQGLSQDTDSDEAWEKLLDQSTPLPKLDAFAKAALQEGSEPLDPDQL